MASCKICNEAVISSGTDTVQCFGACGGNFHVRCAGLASLSKTAVKLLNESPNLCWYCNDCVAFQIKDVTSSLGEMKESLVKLMDTVATTKAAVVNSASVCSPATIGPTLNFAGSVSSLKRWRVGNGSVGTHFPQSPAPISVMGSNEADNTIKAVAPRKLVFVSQLHPTTTADDISQYLASQVQIEKDSHVRANVLLPRGRTIEELDFVSVKLSIPESLFEKVMSPSVWPRGVTIREFISRPYIPNRTLGAFLTKRTEIIGPPSSEMVTD